MLLNIESSSWRGFPNRYLNNFFHCVLESHRFTCIYILVFKSGRVHKKFYVQVALINLFSHCINITSLQSKATQVNSFQVWAVFNCQPQCLYCQLPLRRYTLLNEYRHYKSKTQYLPDVLSGKKILAIFSWGNP
jgi:hypothetical protein